MGSRILVGSRSRPELRRGWGSAEDTLNRVRLHLDVLDEARAFAKREGLDERIIAPQRALGTPKSDANNLCYDRVRT
jgi:hypothetical protein